MIELAIDVTTVSAKWKRAFPRMKPKIEQAAAFAFLRAKKPPAFKDRVFTIDIQLIGDAAIKKLNRTHMGKDKPTNVLSFPQMTFKGRNKTKLPKSESFALPLGDVVLAFEAVKRESKAEHKTIEAHTLHLVIHGVLHLLGYDHMKAGDAKVMEKLERDILAALGYPDPYDIATL